MKNDLEIKNEDCIRKYQLSVVMTEEKIYARNALISHINSKYKTQIPLQSPQQKVTK